MIKLKILRIKNNSHYVLLNEELGMIFTLILEFHNVKVPVVGDYLIFNKKLLNRNFKGFAQPYALSSIKLEEIEAINDFDLFILQTKNSYIKLKRIYG